MWTLPASSGAFAKFTLLMQLCKTFGILYLIEHIFLTSYFYQHREHFNLLVAWSEDASSGAARAAPRQMRRIAETVFMVPVLVCNGQVIAFSQHIVVLKENPP